VAVVVIVVSAANCCGEDTTCVILRASGFVCFIIVWLASSCLRRLLGAASDRSWPADVVNDDDDDDDDELSVLSVLPLPPPSALLRMAEVDEGEVDDAIVEIMVALSLSTTGRREFVALVAVAELETVSFSSSPILPLQRSILFVVGVAMIGHGFVLNQSLVKKML
jgi:hypothetical protein